MTASRPIRFLTYPSLGDMQAHVRAELLGHALSLRMGRPVVVEMAPTDEALEQELEAGRVDMAWATADQCARFESRAWAVLRAVRFGRESTTPADGLLLTHRLSREEATALESIILELNVTGPPPLEKHLHRLASFPLLHPAPMMELGMEGSLLYANPAAHAHFPDLVARGRSHPVVEATLARIRDPEATLPSTVHLEERSWELTVLALPDAGVLRVFLQDVTARKQMEERLILQDRLAALGSMTAGITHELRNPLNFVTSFSEFSGELVQEVTDELNLLESRLGSEHLARLKKSLADLALNISKVQEHGSRMEGIIRSMLEHSRGGTGERRELALNALLSDSINLAYHGMRSRFPTLDVKLEQELDESAGLVEVVPQELSRVLVNLLENACYAVSAKRRLRGPEGFQPRIRVSTRGADDTVEIHIHDNGMGIPKAIRNRLFTPFFTTKPAGEGTGLGLSLSHDIIVKGHGGTLRFESEEGVFTEFIITLPRRRA